MPGVIGGTVDCRSLSAMADAMDREPWYGTEALAAGDRHVALVHHAERDPAGRTTWDGGDAVGVVHGVVSNRAALGRSTADLFRRVLDAPDAVLPSLNGPFLLVAAVKLYDFRAAPDDQQQAELTQFLENVSLAGGALAFLAVGGQHWAYAVNYALF